MPDANAYFRRLASAWLMLCVAGLGVGPFAAPVVVERDMEVETAEIYLCRELFGTGGPRRDRTPPASVPPRAKLVRAGGTAMPAIRSADRRLRLFRTLRASEIRIQV